MASLSTEMHPAQFTAMADVSANLIFAHTSLMVSSGVPWRELRPNPRDQREEAAASASAAAAQALPTAEVGYSSKDAEDAVAAAKGTSGFLQRFSAPECSRRLAFGAICGGVTGIAFGLSN